jgi:hypothetical protein
MEPENIQKVACDVPSHASSCEDCNVIVTEESPDLSLPAAQAGVEERPFYVSSSMAAFSKPHASAVQPSGAT